MCLMSNLHTATSAPPLDEPEHPQPGWVRRGAPGRPRAPGGEKGFLLVLAGAIAVVVALLPFARVLDDHVDRQRPMYRDVATMAWLQYRHIKETGDALPLELEEGQGVAVGGRQFTPSSGVSVQVRATKDGYCVRGRNNHGDVTAWQCGDGATDPSSPE